MSQDLIAAYEKAIDDLVQLIEAFPKENTLVGTEATEDPDLLTGFVDVYAAQAGGVFDNVIARASGEMTYDRLLALAAGDFRLAAALVSVDEPWPVDEAEADDRAADVEVLKAALGDLRAEMGEVKAAVRGPPEGADGGGGGPLPSRPQPPRGGLRAGIPPLHESIVVRALELVAVPTSEELAREQVEALGRPVSGAASESVELVHDYIDAVLGKASKELADLAIGGAAVALDIAPEVGKKVSAKFGEVSAEFGDLLAGYLGSWYGRVQDELGDWKHRAKRSALKLLYEGIDKLLSILRYATPVGALSTESVRDVLTEAAEWLRGFVLTHSIQGRLEVVLHVPDLKTHVETAFKASTPDERAKRAVSVGGVAKKYREKKFPMRYACVLVRAVRLLGLHHIAPPSGEIAMGCTILTLCGVSGWMLQDALDYPELRFVPDLSPGVRSAVEGS